MDDRCAFPYANSVRAPEPARQSPATRQLLYAVATAPSPANRLSSTSVYQPCRAIISPWISTLVPPGTVDTLLYARPTANERYIQFPRFGARSVVQRTNRVPSLVGTVACFCARLFRIAWVENDFVVNVARGHGRSVSNQRFSMRPRSLPLHWAIFHPWRCCFPRLWPRASAAWTVRVEVDRHCNNHWRRASLLHSGVASRSVSAKRLRGLTTR